jgi:hypothetical protein
MPESSILGTAVVVDDCDECYTLLQGNVVLVKYTDNTSLPSYLDSHSQPGAPGMADVVDEVDNVYTLIPGEFFLRRYR